MKRMTIGQVAKAAGVASSTVRYYERRGLLRATDRSAGNYRLYDESSLDRLIFVRSAQEAGFTLSDIEVLLDLRDHRRGPCQEVQGLILHRLEQVVEQSKRLREIEAMLVGWLGVCKDAEQTGRCAVIAGLDGEGKGEIVSGKGKKCPK